MKIRSLTRAAALVALLLIGGASMQGLAFASGGTLEIATEAPELAAATEPVKEVVAQVETVVETEPVAEPVKEAVEPVKEATEPVAGTVENTTEQVTNATQEAAHTESAAVEMSAGAPTPEGAIAQSQGSNTTAAPDPQGTETQGTTGAQTTGAAQGTGAQGTTAAQGQIGAPKQMAGGELVATRGPTDPDDRSPKEVLSDIVAAGQGIEAGTGAAVKGRRVTKDNGAAETSLVEKAKDAVKLALTGLAARPYLGVALLLIAAGDSLRRRRPRRVPTRVPTVEHAGAALMARRLPFGTV